MAIYDLHPNPNQCNLFLSLNLTGSTLTLTRVPTRFVVAELVSKLNLSSQHEKQFDESFDHTQQQRLRLQGVIQQTERGVLWV